MNKGKQTAKQLGRVVGHESLFAFFTGHVNLIIYLTTIKLQEEEYFWGRIRNWTAIDQMKLGSWIRLLVHHFRAIFSRNTR